MTNLKGLNGGGETGVHGDGQLMGFSACAVVEECDGFLWCQGLGSLRIKLGVAWHESWERLSSALVGTLKVLEALHAAGGPLAKAYALKVEQRFTPDLISWKKSGDGEDSWWFLVETMCDLPTLADPCGDW